MENLVDRVQVNHKCVVTFHRCLKTNDYVVRAYLYNRQIYGRKINKKYYVIFRDFIIEKIKFIEEEEVLSRDYIMVDIGNRMYKRIDSNAYHFKELVQLLVPLDYEIEDDYIRYDMLLNSELYNIETHSSDELVYKYETFYHNGNKLKTLDDLDRDRVSYDKFELNYGISSEILKYLVSDYYSPDFITYTTSKTKVRIDKWY